MRLSSDSPLVRRCQVCPRGRGHPSVHTKTEKKNLILLDTSVSLMVVINMRYIRAAPSVQETLSLQDLPQCPVNISATEIKTECTIWPPEQNLMTLGYRRMSLRSKNISLFKETAHGSKHSCSHPFHRIKADFPSLRWQEMALTVLRVSEVREPPTCFPLGPARPLTPAVPFTP